MNSLVAPSIAPRSASMLMALAANPFFDLQSADRDPPRHGLLRLFERQGQHAVFELRADLLLIDLVRQCEGPGEMAGIVLCIRCSRGPSPRTSSSRSAPRRAERRSRCRPPAPAVDAGKFHDDNRTPVHLDLI